MSEGNGRVNSQLALGMSSNPTCTAPVPVHPGHLLSSYHVQCCVQHWVAGGLAQPLLAARVGPCAARGGRRRCVRPSARTLSRRDHLPRPRPRAAQAHAAARVRDALAVDRGASAPLRRSGDSETALQELRFTFGRVELGGTSSDP